MMQERGEEVAEVDVEVKPHASEEVREYDKPYFLYSTKIVSNPILLQNEYARDDFYFLRFPVPSSFKGDCVSLKLTELSSKEYSSATWSNMKVGNNRLLIVDSIMGHCFNPKKHLTWVHDLKHIVGDLYKIELTEGEESITRYLCFDYFSYENYVAALIEISYYQRLVKTRKEKSSEAAGNVFANLNRSPSMSKTAFRSILHRLKSAHKGRRPFAAARPLLSVKYSPHSRRSQTVVEYKNCAVEAISLTQFRVLAGNLHGLKSKHQLEQNNGIVTVSESKPEKPLKKNFESDKARTKSLQVSLYPNLSKRAKVSKHLLFDYQSPRSAEGAMRRAEQHRDLVKHKTLVNFHSAKKHDALSI